MLDNLETALRAAAPKKFAARVDFGPERKQALLELRSEPERLNVVCGLLERAAEAITLERALAEVASKNGRGVGRER